MAVNLYSAAPPYGLFNIIGKLFQVMKDINISRGTTIPTDILNSITYFNTIPANAALTQIFDTVPGAITDYQSGPLSCLSTLQLAAQNIVITMVDNDVNQPDSSLTTALNYIIAQMKATAASVNQSAVTVVATAGGTNTGNGVLITSTKRGDGLVQESILAETLTGTFSLAGLTSNLTLTGQATASANLGQDWPQGSGTGSSLNSVDAGSSSLLNNGGMELFNNQVNVPDNWILKVGTPGTTILQTILEVHQIVISGSPTGTFTLAYANAAGKLQVTLPIPFATVSNSTIQSALQALQGLGSVVVNAISGVSPNITVQVVYAGAGGGQTLLVGTSDPAGASIVVTRTTTGTPQVFAGSYAVQFKSNGAELTEIWQQVNDLTANTAYGINLYACVDAVAAAGVVKVELYDGSAIINDSQGVANALTFNASSLTVNFQSLKALQASECVFRLPAVVPPLVYVRIRISTAITAAKSMFLDNVGFTPLTQIYSAGPLLALFSGNVPWTTVDTFSVVTTNTRAGVVREWCERAFNMSSLGLLFPSSGAPTIPDSVVS